MVGVTGFGPAISCSQGRRDDQPSLHPIDKAGVLLRQRGGSNRSPVTRSRRSQCPTPWRMAAFRPTFQPFVGNPGAEPGVSRPRSERITVFLVPVGGPSQAVLRAQAENVLAVPEPAR